MPTHEAGIANPGTWLRAAFVLAVSAWLLLVLGAFPATPGGLLLAVPVAAAGLTALALLLRVLLRRASPRVRDLPARLAFAAALAVAGIELLLRLAGALLPAAPEWLPASAGVERQLAAYRFEPGAVRLRFPCNSLGFYDEEPPRPGSGTRWVAVLGDSFVASSVPQPVHFTSVAEAATGLVVQAFGVHAAGPREYLELLRRDVLPLGPDAVVLVLFAGNDVSDSLRAEASWFGRVFDPRNARLLFVPARLAHGGASGRAATQRGRVQDGTIILDSPQGELRGSVRQLQEALPVLMPWLFDPALETPQYAEEEFLDIERTRVLQACLPDAPGWAPFERLLDELLAAAGEAPVAVLLLPDQFQVEDALWEQVRGAAGGRAPVRDLPQRRIGDLLAARGVPCLDVLPALRAAAAGGESLYLRQDTHLNLRGNELVGRALGEFLAEWGPGR
ncbi:MAG: hypothetical protein FJ296_10535 [Planctomycetes bacterium]|nr:hypothetical protein [Planctomycetota bacterium]